MSGWISFIEKNPRKCIKIFRGFFLVFFLHRAYDDLKHHQYANDHKNKVEKDPGETKQFLHPPLKRYNGDDSSEEHDEEEATGTEEAFSRDSHRGETMDD